MKTFCHIPLCCLLLVSASAGAADPAKTLFGVELGTRFLIPPCARGEDTMTNRHCHNPATITTLPGGISRHQVFYPRPQLVPYARGELNIDVVNGIIEAIHVHTWGIQGQGTALEALTAKYGLPTRSRSEHIKGQRSRYPSKFAEWDLKDFTVKLDGTTTTIDWGRITLASDRYRKIQAGATAR